MISTIRRLARDPELYQLVAYGFAFAGFLTLVAVAPFVWVP